MGVFEYFPYTNFHDLNLDWILQQMKTLANQWGLTEEQWENMKKYIENFFKNLNLQTEVDNKIQDMIEDGTMNTLLENMLSPFVVVNPDDSASVIQTKANTLTNGGTLYFMPGTYIIDNDITIPANVTVQGSEGGNSTIPGGSILDFRNNSITLNSGCTFQNFSILYSEQHLQPNNTPTSYPYTLIINTGARRVNIRNLIVYNSYNFISCAQNHESLTVENINGYCINNFIILDGGNDIDRLINIHLNYNIYNNYLEDASLFGAWTRNNSTAFIIRRADWGIMNKCFAYGYNIGATIGGESYTCNGFRVSNCGFDACGAGLIISNSYSISVSQTSFTGINPFTETSYSTFYIQITDSTSTTFENCGFWNIVNHIFSITNSNVNIANNRFRSWSTSTEGTYYIAYINDTSSFLTFAGNICYYDGRIIAGVQNYYCSISNNIFSNTNNIISGTSDNVSIINNIYSDINNQPINVFTEETVALADANHGLGIKNANNTYELTISNNILRYLLNNVTIMPLQVSNLVLTSSKKMPNSLWVNSSKQLIFTDSSGTDHVLA